jgi:hypothetical protein
VHFWTVGRVGGAGYFALSRLVCTDVPKRQKLADCNTNALGFTMTCHHSPPYQLVLGLGPSLPRCPVMSVCANFSCSSLTLAIHKFHEFNRSSFPVDRRGCGAIMAL